MKRLIFSLFIVMLAAGMAQAQNITGRYAWEGTLDGKIAIRLAIEVNSEGIVAGSILYPKAKKAAPILVVGSTYEGGMFYLSEYLADGRVTGNMGFEIKGGLPVGEWTNPKTLKSYQFTSMRKIAFPNGFGGKLVPESPGNIGHEYGFMTYSEPYNDYMGGNFTFRAAGKNKVHFEACNAVRNIAEGESEAGRPAVLSGNHFVYRNVNECGYGFEAFFYPQFMVARSVTDGDTVGCFGMGASLEGVYIKTKK